ncbi:MAG: SgcJ/EcaC family oxidoreductase [Cyanobacteria bacterium J06635_1]
MILERALVVSMIEQAAQAWRDERPHDFVALFAPSGVFIVPGNRWIGHTSIHQAITDYFVTKTNVVIVIHQIIVENNHAMVEWSWSDSDRKTQLHPDLPALARSHAEDAIAIDFDPEGKILRWREYIDAL